MINRILNYKSKTLTFAAVLLGFFTLISKILGLVRDRLLAGRVPTEELDIYFASFRIPDLVYGLVIAGGIVSVFLPLYSEYYKKGKANEFTNYILNAFLLILVGASLLLIIFTRPLMKMVAPGFSPEKIETAVLVTRIMFLSPIFLGISSIFSGILHYFNRFLVYSLAPIAYNLGIIFGIIFLYNPYGVVGLAYGVVLGAFLHLLVQVPLSLKLGFSYKMILDFTFPGLKKVFKLMVPRTLGVASNHINLIIITSIASLLASGSIAIFNLANNLHYFPIGIIGFSFAISSFPAFSKLYVNGQKKEFFYNFSSSLRQILFYVLPAVFLMFILRAHIVRLILGTGEFGWRETRLTAASLGIFSLATLAGSLIPLLTKAFFAMQDTKTPFYISSLSVAFNLLFSFSFVYFLSFTNFFSNFFTKFLRLETLENIQVIALPLSFSLITFLQVILLFYFIKKKIEFFNSREIYLSFFKNLLSILLTVPYVYLSLYIASSFVNMRTYFGILTQTSISLLIGIIIYLVFSYVLNSKELILLKKSLIKQFKK